MIKETVTKLKEQREQLEKVIFQKPTDKKQKEAIEKAKALLKNVNSILETLNA